MHPSNIIWTKNGYVKGVIHDGIQNIFILEDMLGNFIASNISSYVISMIFEKITNKTEYRCITGEELWQLQPSLNVHE